MRPIALAAAAFGAAAGGHCGAERVRAERQDHGVLSWEGCQGSSSILSPLQERPESTQGPTAWAGLGGTDVGTHLTQATKK